MKREYSFPSSEGRTRIHTVIWEPKEKPKAILQIAHGMAEYMERYEKFALFLNEKGILVAGNDHLGHGISICSEEDWGYFAEREGHRAVLRDMHRLTCLLQKEYPHIPCFLFGHSMGSFLSRRYLCVYPWEMDGAILCGTGWQPRPLLAAGIGLTKMISLFKGGHFRSAFVDSLAFGGMNRAFSPARTKKDWLTRDEKTVDAYLAEKRCGYLFTVNGYGGLFRTIALAEKGSLLKRMEKTLPVLFISGEKDPVGGFGKGVKRAVRAFRKAGMEDVACILYPDCRHELLNELNKEEIYEDIWGWLKGKLRS